MPLRVRSLLRLFRVVDGWLLIQARAAAPEWIRSIAAYYEAHQRAFPDSIPKPKQHMMMHLSERSMYNTLVHERKHKAFKQFASISTRRDCLGPSILADVFTEQLRGFQDIRLGTFLESASEYVGPLLARLGIERASASLRATHALAHSARDDFVWIDCDDETLSPALVRLRLDVQPPPAGSSGFVTVVQWFLPTAEAGLWRLDPHLSAVPLERISWLATHCRADGGRRILQPPPIEYSQPL